MVSAVSVTSTLLHSTLQTQCASPDGATCLLLQTDAAPSDKTLATTLLGNKHGYGLKINNSISVPFRNNHKALYRQTAN